MAVARHADCVRRETQACHEPPNFFDRQRSAERMPKKFPLIRVRVTRISLHEVLKRPFVTGARQVAMKKQTAGRGNSHGFGEHSARFWNVVDYTVADDYVE
jgi:hypothetical protein